MPFIRGKFKKAVFDLVAFRGFVGSTFVSKESTRDNMGGALDNDFFIINISDCPLKWLVNNR